MDTNIVNKSNNKKHYILIISMVVFVLLNLIENFLHYNIGRNHSNGIFTLHNPNSRDWVYIVTVMVIFGFLQGWFTEYFDNLFE